MTSSVRPLPATSFASPRIVLATLNAKLESPKTAQDKFALESKVKIAKLEIFPDCQVAIEVQTGQWDATPVNGTPPLASTPT